MSDGGGFDIQVITFILTVVNQVAKVSGLL
jgi:hypothetical protein